MPGVAGYTLLSSYSSESWESTEEALVPRPMASEERSEVGTGWDRLGDGCLIQWFGIEELFSESLVLLITVLMSSFCFLRCSLLLHHIGRLYSQLRPRCLHALHLGLASSHFFRRRRHVKHPACSQYRLRMISPKLIQKHT
jgi:hypothetical protein